jgi:hypothetical protein
MVAYFNVLASWKLGEKAAVRPVYLKRFPDSKLRLPCDSDPLRPAEQHDTIFSDAEKCNLKPMYQYTYLGHRFSYSREVVSTQESSKRGAKRDRENAVC